MVVSYINVCQSIHLFSLYSSIHSKILWLLIIIKQMKYMPVFVVYSIYSCIVYVWMLSVMPVCVVNNECAYQSVYVCVVYNVWSVWMKCVCVYGWFWFTYLSFSEIISSNCCFKLRIWPYWEKWEKPFFKVICNHDDIFYVIKMWNM